MPTAIQVSAKAKSTTSANAASHSMTVALVDRKPMATATVPTRTTLMIDCSTQLRTCPTITDGRWIAIVRKRAMMPSVMSLETNTAVPIVVLPMVISSKPGTTYAMYAGPHRLPRQPGPPSDRTPRPPAQAGNATGAGRACAATWARPRGQARVRGDAQHPHGGLGPAQDDGPGAGLPLHHRRGQPHRLRTALLRWRIVCWRARMPE